MSSAVRFAAPMPARRAVTNASLRPARVDERSEHLGTHPHDRLRDGSRAVSFDPTSTIRGAPSSERMGRPCRRLEDDRP